MYTADTRGVQPMVRFMKNGNPVLISLFVAEIACLA